MDITITPEFVAAVAGAIVSLAFSYIPGLNAKFAALSAEVKRLIMVGIMALVTAGVYIAGCQGWVNTGLVCGQDAIIKLVSVFIAAVVANQGVYSLTPQPAAVREAK